MNTNTYRVSPDGPDYEQVGRLLPANLGDDIGIFVYECPTCFALTVDPRNHEWSAHPRA